MFGIQSYLPSPKEMQRHMLSKRKYLRRVPDQKLVPGEGDGVNRLSAEGCTWCLSG